MEFQKDTVQNAPLPSDGQKKADSAKNFWKDLVVFIIVAAAIVGLFRTFAAPYTVEPFIVVGASMDPTFKTGQYLIVDNFTYHFVREPKRLDVIIMRYPRDPQTYYIKRIVGLPGETITVKDGKITIINKENPKGIAIDDSFVIDAHKTHEAFSLTLRDTEYFVMGDNRAESSDSRAWGPLEKKYIVGRPFLRLFPFNKISAFPGEVN